MGEDGKTPLERTRGRKGRDHMAEIGESVLYIPLRGDIGERGRAKVEMEARFKDGIFLGLADRSDEILVYGDEGVRKARTIRRRPEEERWRKDALMAVRGTPLQPNPGANDVRIHTCMNPGLAQQSTMGEPVTRQELRKELGETRRFQLLRRDVRAAAKVIGYTPNCPGCKGVVNNLAW